MPVVILPHPLESHTGGACQVSVEGSTVAAALRNLVDKHPALSEFFFDEYSDEVHGYINLFLNDRDIHFSQGLDTHVSEDDRILVLPVVAGG